MHYDHHDEDERVKDDSLRARPSPDPDWREVARIAGEIIACDERDEVSVKRAVELARQIIAAAKARP